MSLALKTLESSSPLSTLDILFKYSVLKCSLNSLLTGTKHPQTRHDYSPEQHKNLNKQTGELPTYAQTKLNGNKAWFRVLYAIRHGSSLLYSSRGLPRV